MKRQDLCAIDWDVVIVGGGLAAGLLALRLEERRPGIRYLLVESGSSLGGTDTWSFHASDLSTESAAWIEPLVSRRWEGHEVFFPAYARRLRGGYASIRSEQFHGHIASRCEGSVLFDCAAVRVAKNAVTLDDGTVLRAGVVLDARGFPELEADAVGYQKFFGLDLELYEPHGLTGPVLMDARCEQRDGFRFFYVLPFSETRALVEDTRYADGATVDTDECRGEIRRYAEARGWRIREEGREESGVLPIPLAASFFRDGTPREYAVSYGVPTLGVRAGLFHPTTGYSLPDVVRAAERLAALPRFDAPSVTEALAELSTEVQVRRRFFRFLNRMLFLGARPTDRYRILEKFYRLPESTIARFYSARLSVVDRFRLLAGKPPVPFGAAVRCIAEPVRGREAALREMLFRYLTPQEVGR